VPARIDLLAFPTAAPATVAPGSSFNVVVDDIYPGGPCMLFVSFGSTHLFGMPGIGGRVFLDLGTATVIGTGTTPATFGISVAANPTLAGLNLTARAYVTSGSGTPVSGPSQPRFVAIR
jgi:hypothetical protein